ncbi:MAG: hypothetical protein ACYTGW_22745 [Planctomycetota bacterium]|jgi:hypothetical protein
MIDHPEDQPLDPELPRPDIRPDDVMVEVLSADTTETVMEITRLLHSVGIPAVPDVGDLLQEPSAEQIPGADTGPDPGDLETRLHDLDAADQPFHRPQVTRVLVPEQYAAVAQQMLDATTHKPQGPDCMAEIAAGFAEQKLPGDRGARVEKVLAWLVLLLLGGGVVVGLFQLISAFFR